MHRPVVALVTDFGTMDGYVGAIKGVLVRRAPGAEIVDISHDVPPGDVLAAAWILASAWRFFPDRTTFMCVVDPGVGSDRRAIAFTYEKKFGVGPDNGLFTLVLGDAKPEVAVELVRREHWEEPTSAVFHGRDIFAPVAASLARGAHVEELGDPVPNIHRLPLPRPASQKDGTVEGHVIHIDRFGNAVTDIRADLLPDVPVAVEVGGKRAADLVHYYAEAPSHTLVALINSAGHLELAVRGESAARLAGIERGTAVRVTPIAPA